MTILHFGSSFITGATLRSSASSMSFSGILGFVNEVAGFSLLQQRQRHVHSAHDIRRIYVTALSAIGRSADGGLERRMRGSSSLRKQSSTQGIQSSLYSAPARVLSSSPGSGFGSFVRTEDAERRNLDPGCVAFVTGANRGIGLELTRQLLERTKGKVIAACREPSKSTDLQGLSSTLGGNERLHVVKLDVTNQTSVDLISEYMKTSYGRLDLLFNVAGILGDGKSTPGPERSLRVMDRDWLRQTLEVNAVGPMMLAAAFAPLMESTSKKGSEMPARPPAIVVNFSARVGSIGDNNLGGWHSYRMSKAALNMATKGISLELRRRRVWAFSYHPGTTDTGLSKPFQTNVRPEKLFSTTYTVSQVLSIVDSMTDEMSGGFYAFDGSRIEW